MDVQYLNIADIGHIRFIKSLIGQLIDYSLFENYITSHKGGWEAVCSRASY